MSMNGAPFISLPIIFFNFASRGTGCSDPHLGLLSPQRRFMIMTMAGGGL
jgi:hypothetical protein